MADQSYSSSGGFYHHFAAVPVENDITSAGTHLSYVTGARRFTLTSVSIIVTDDITGASTATVKRYKTLDDASPVTIGTITVPTGATAGAVYVREFTTDIEPGEALVVSHDATPSAGKATAVIEGYQSPVQAGADGVAKVNSGTGSVYLVTS